MRIRVTHQIDRLARDAARLTVRSAGDMARTVRKNTEQGGREAQRIAKKKSGRHGKNFHKRITSEMTGAMEGEFGITEDIGGPPVGAGFRHAGPNTDLAKAADIQGPKFAQDVAKLPERWFW